MKIISKPQGAVGNDFRSVWMTTPFDRRIGRAPIYQIPSSIDGVLGAIRDQLVASGLFSYKNCVVAINPWVYPKYGQYYCTLRPLGMVPEQSYADGGGRDTMMLHARFEVRLFARNLTDPVDEDTNRLLGPDPKLSLYAMGQVCQEQLDLYWPTDTTGNTLTVEPIRYDGTTGGVYHPGGRQWGSITLTYTASFVNAYQTGICGS